MKRSLLITIKEFLCRNSKNPWACYETNGIKDGKVEFSISWNKQFIKNLNEAGFDGMTEEEVAQLFFMYTKMTPEGMTDENDVVNPEATPRLSSEANILKK